MSGKRGTVVGGSCTLSDRFFLCSMSLFLFLSRLSLSLDRLHSLTLDFFLRFLFCPSNSRPPLSSSRRGVAPIVRIALAGDRMPLPPTLLNFFEVRVFVQIHSQNGSNMRNSSLLQKSIFGSCGEGAWPLALVLGPLVLVLPTRSAGVGDLSSLEVRTQLAEVVTSLFLYRKRAGNYITQVASPNVT